MLKKLFYVDTRTFALTVNSMNFMNIFILAYLIISCNADALSDTNIAQAVTDWLTGGDARATVISTYGQIETWDTSQITSLKDVFKSTLWPISSNPAIAGSPDLTAWDISKVTSLKDTFRDSSFNGDISTWDTGKVKSFRYAFMSNSYFTGLVGGGLANWNVSEGTDFGFIFYGASKFNGDISKWITTKMDNLVYAFSGATVFNSDISKWDVLSISTATEAFDGAKSYSRTICSKKWMSSVFSSKHRLDSGLPTEAGGRIFCCGTGEHLDANSNSTCRTCPSGYSQDGFNVLPDCQRCDRDTFSPADGLSKCTSCDPLQFSAVASTVCTLCPAGWSTTRNASVTYCSQCRSGLYQPLSGETSCKRCPKGYAQSDEGSSYCPSCNAGLYSNVQESSICKECTKGRYQHDSFQDHCIECKLGFAQSEKGSSYCFRCSPGTYSNVVESSACIECSIGRYMADSGSEKKCKECSIGRFIAVVRGVSCEPCLAGKYNDELGIDASDGCKQCPIGTYSFILGGGAKSSTCSSCNGGKYSNEKGSSICKECSINQYQPQESVPSSTCLDCPIGWNQPLKGQMSCLDLGGLKPIDCKNDEYFNTTNSICLDCPRGASCIGAVTESTVSSKFGYARCPSHNFKFVECVVHTACLGKINVVLEGKYYMDQKLTEAEISAGVKGPLRIDLAMMDHNESCADGHINPPTSNLRCASCNDGYAMSNGICLKCSKGGGLGFMIAAVICGVFFFVVIVGMKLKSSGHRKAEHSTMKRTFLTHIQMVSIVLSLNVPWPLYVRTCMEFVSSFLSVNAAASSVQCGVGGMSMNDFYYGALVASVLLPFVMVGFTYVYWIVAVPHCKCLSCGITLKKSKWCPNVYTIHNIVKRRFSSTDRRREYSTSSHSENLENGQSQETKRNSNGSNLTSNSTSNSTSHTKKLTDIHSTRDGWIITMVLMIYLLFPSIVKSSFQMLQYETVCGTKVWGQDNSVLFNSKKHQFMVFTVAIPALSFFAFLLPGIIMYYISKHPDRQTNKKLILRFGLLYSGYKPSLWYYELVLYVRKLSIILIVTFLGSYGQQLHVALGVLVVLLYLQEHLMPFEGVEGDGHDKEVNARLHRVESGALLVLILMVWSAVYFALSPCDDNDTVCSVLGVSVLGANFIFTFSCGLTVWKAFSEKIHLVDKLQHRVSQIKRRMTRLGSNFGMHSFSTHSSRNSNNSRISELSNQSKSTHTSTDSTGVDRNTITMDMKAIPKPAVGLQVEMTTMKNAKQKNRKKTTMGRGKVKQKKKMNEKKKSHRRSETGTEIQENPIPSGLASLTCMEEKSELKEWFQNNADVFDFGGGTEGSKTNDATSSYENPMDKKNKGVISKKELKTMNTKDLIVNL